MSYQQLILELSQNTEKEWIEYKSNNDHPQKIGEYISALANSAKLHSKNNAYMIWGVDDGGNICGTNFEPYKMKGKGNEDLISWIARGLDPSIHFQIEELEILGKKIVIFDIIPSLDRPVEFYGVAFIRVGSYKKPLKNYPEKARILWQRSGSKFEQGIAKENLTQEEVFSLLDWKRYFILLNEDIPQNTEAIIERFVQEGLIKKKVQSFHITNLGSLLLANKLTDFDDIRRKGVRVITYKGVNKLHAVKEQIGSMGYASGFEGLLMYIESQIPNEENFDSSVRKTISQYPSIAIREFVANALVHQDFVTGQGTTIMVEIFDDRIEITNPGVPLIETDRFIDHPPKSRNELLTDMMRRMGICEERGSGVDRALVAIELNKLPAPKFERGSDFTKVTLYRKKSVSKMTTEEKLRACYQHCCITWIVDRQPMKNDSLCTRLDVEEKNKAIVSRIIKEARDKGLIKPFDPETSTRKYAKYIPYWA